MTFITNTITNANPGPTLYTAIETAMLADGWTLVDTVVIGSNTHKVLKSAAAGNAQGLDWYLDINYPTTGVTGGIRFCPFETYDAVTHTAGNGPYSVANSTIDGTTYSRFGTTKSALETNWANTATYSGLSTALQTTAFTYRISVTRNRIVGQLSNVTGAIFYAGFFNPSSAFTSNAGAALFPLITTVLSGTTGSTSNSAAASVAASLTRLPKVSTMGGNGWAWHCGVGSFSTVPWPEGQLNVAVSPFTGRSTVAPLPVAASGSLGSGSGLATPASAAPQVDTIGTIDDVGYAFVNTSSQQGDTVTIGSDTWYATLPSSSMNLLFKAI